MGFLAALLPLLSGLTEPIKQYFQNKAQIAKAEQEYKLALLQAQAQQAVAEVESETRQNSDRLNATTQGFKQNTWYVLCGLILFSVIFPGKAEVMWHNFSLIPAWFQNLFVGITLVIWGINPVKSGAMWLTDVMGSARENSRNYKLEKIKALNEKAVFDSLRETIFKQGLTEDQVRAVQAALAKGQE